MKRPRLHAAEAAALSSLATYLRATHAGVVMAHDFDFYYEKLKSPVAKDAALMMVGRVPEFGTSREIALQLATWLTTRSSAKADAARETGRRQDVAIRMAREGRSRAVLRRRRGAM